MRNKRKYIWVYDAVFCLVLFSIFCSGDSIQLRPALLSNIVQLNPPSWLSGKRARKVQHKIENTLGWRLNLGLVIWHNSLAEYHNNCGFYSMACTDWPHQTIHMGPSINSANFNQVYAHELVHLMLYGKFKKNFIPHWLHEGFAEFISRKKAINYAQLAADRVLLRNPIELMNESVNRKSNSVSSFDKNEGYLSARAFVEMIDSRCGAANFLKTVSSPTIWIGLEYSCGIHNPDLAYRDWLLKQSGLQTRRQRFRG